MNSEPEINDLSADCMTISKGNYDLLNRTYDYKERWRSIVIKINKLECYGEVKLADSEDFDMAVIVHRVGKVSNDPGARMLSFSRKAAVEMKNFLNINLSKRESNIFSPRIILKAGLDVRFEKNWIVSDSFDEDI